MMTNLFSSFDPSTNIYMSINWISMWIFTMIIPLSFWLKTPWPIIMLNLLNKKLHKEFLTILDNKSSTLMFISLFLIIMMNNITSLLPYIFTSTSHMVMTLSLAMPLWLGVNTFGWMKKTNYMFQHLVPMGTPAILMPFMVCIETISSLIRPMTLAIRLAANMIAGHLLLTLLGNTGTSINELLLISMLTLQLALFMLESAVAIIQAYVFSILASLYSSEIN